MNEKAQLDSSLTLRPARWTDVEAVAKLTHETAEKEGDALFVMTAKELENAWRGPGFSLDRDVFVVETRDGRLEAKNSTSGVITAISKQTAVSIQNSGGWESVRRYWKK